MLFKASIQVMPIKGLLDPQGKAVNASLHNIGMVEIHNVRIGKEITLEVEAENEEAAGKIVDDACNKLLHNPVMEEYTFTVVPA